MKCAANVGQLREAGRLGGTLTQAVKHPHDLCCMAGHVFKGVHWGDLNNMKMMSRNTKSPISLVYPSICVGS